MRALEEDPEIKDDEIVLAPEDEGDPALLAELAQMELEDGDPNPASQAGVRVAFSLSVLLCSVDVVWCLIFCVVVMN